jgi:hypothetical protein
MLVTGLAAVLIRGRPSHDQAARALAVVLAQSSHTDSVLAAVPDPSARARQDSINRAQPGYVVDSILPVEEELRRFRAVVGARTTALGDGAKSLGDLVRRFVSAVEQSDTAALSRLTLSAREFAWLVYPSSPYTKAPYRQAPGLVWMSIDTPSDVGRRRLLKRAAGQTLGFVGYGCKRPVERQGENMLHVGCVLELRKGDGAISRTRLFGTVIERNGVFKFVSFDNDL